ncbi:MAG: hypothetical protein WCF90_01540 [Methanomicrobiales archaeon]
MKFAQKTGSAVTASPGTARLSFLKEQSIKTVFSFEDFSAVTVVTFILLFLLRDGFPIFSQVGILSFLLGPGCAPTAVVTLYEISPFIGGILLVTMGGPWSLPSRFLPSVQFIFPNQKIPQVGSWTTGR